MLGVPWECYQSARNERLFNKLGIDMEPRFCKCTAPHDINLLKKPLPIKTYLQTDSNNIAKLKLGVMFNGWTRIKKEVVEAGRRVVRQK